MTDNELWAKEIIERPEMDENPLLASITFCFLLIYLLFAD